MLNYFIVFIQNSEFRIHNFFMNENSSRLESRASILALDWGAKKIGVAVLPSSVRVAVPLGVIENTTDEEILEKISEWVAEYEVEKIAIGLPVSMSGEEGAQATSVRQGSKIIEQLNLPIEFVDERLTSQSGGEQAKLAGAVSDDAYAAVQILEKYLEF